MVTRSRLTEGLSRLFDRASLIARGGEQQQDAARGALEAGRVMEARSLARGLAERMPDSPSVLGLWAEAADACGLDEEALVVLRRLAACVPWRHDVWIAIAIGTGPPLDPTLQEALIRASESAEPEVRRDASFCLADSDLSQGMPHRGLRWLERVPRHRSQPDPEWTQRQAECLLAMGRRRQAEAVAEALPVRAGDGRQNLLLARLCHGREGASAESLKYALRAHLLGEAAAEELLLQWVVVCDDEPTVAKVRSVVDKQGLTDHVRWKATFALLAGDETTAGAQMLMAARGGDEAAARSLLSWAAVRGDWEVVDQLAASQALSSSARGLASLAQRARQQPVEVLDEVTTLRRGGMQKWCDAAVRLAVEQLIPAREPAQWPVLFERLGRVCKTAADPVATRELEALVGTDRLQLRAAVIGEFSVGKTTLMNAWLGAEVGPVGIKPTTAYATWLAYAPDDYVRIDLSDGPSRVLAHGELRACLGKLGGHSSVNRVSIYSHQHELKHLLLLDTPGFNAGKSDHEKRAWQAVEEADIVIWVSDATAPLKDSERRVLEAIGQQGIPVKLVLNKVDRLSAEERESVLRYVRAKADTLGAHLIGSPFGMSARDALREQLRVAAEDDSDLAPSSGWSDWREFVRVELMARAPLHVERAMRRRAAAVAMRLGATTCDAKPTDRSAAIMALQTFTDRCRGEAHEMACQLLDTLGVALNALRDDLEPLRHLSPDGIAADATNYVIGRSLARVQPILCQQFVESAGTAKDVVRSTAHPMFYGLIAAAAASSPTPLTASRLLVPLTTAITEIGSQLQERIPDVGANLDSTAYELDCFVRSLVAPLERLETVAGEQLPGESAS